MAFIDAACAEEHGIYDQVAPFMEVFFDGLRIETTLFSMMGLLFNVRACTCVCASAPRT